MLENPGIRFTRVREGKVCSQCGRRRRRRILILILILILINNNNNNNNNTKVWK